MYLNIISSFIPCLEINTNILSKLFYICNRLASPAAGISGEKFFWELVAGLGGQTYEDVT